MRELAFTVAALAAFLLAGSLTASRTIAAPGPASVAQPPQALGGVEQIHCRPVVHWHPWGYGTGCGVGVGPVVVAPLLVPACVRRCGPLGCRTVCR